MKTFIYTRISTSHQNIQQQIDHLTKRYKADDIYRDIASGKSMQRDGMNNLKSHLRANDTVVAYDISRIGRNVIEVLEFAKYCEEKQVTLIIDQLGQVDVTSATGKLVLTTLAAVAEMQRGELLEKQKIGIARAQSEGRMIGKQISKASVNEYQRVMELVDKQISINKSLELIGMNRSKFFRLKKHFAVNAA